MAKRKSDQPRTALGKRLDAIRKRHVASGVRLLSWTEIMKRLGRNEWPHD